MERIYTDKLNKNDIYELTITDVSSEGFGVAHIDGIAVFVAQALTGDTVKALILSVKSRYAYAKIIEIIQPSHMRIEPVCGNLRCGGCSFLHCEYSHQLTIKRKFVTDALARIGHFDLGENSEIEIGETIGIENPFACRNKASFPVSPEGVGFYAYNSHRIINCEQCVVLPPIHERILKIVREFIKSGALSPYHEESGKGVLKHIVMRFASSGNQVLVCLVVTKPDIGAGLKRNLVKKLSAVQGVKSVLLNINPKPTNVILGDRSELLFGDGYLTEYIGTYAFRISHASFFQVNTEQARVLYDTVLRFADFLGNERVVDAYCGAGTIAVYIARHVAHVKGIEISEGAIKDAEHNSRLNNIGNVEYVHGRTEDVLPECLEGTDALILDPPRKGCDPRVIEAILNTKPQKLIYVSCNPATLARDARLLADGGYKLRRAQPVDMFPHTSSIETVALLTLG